MNSTGGPIYYARSAPPVAISLGGALTHELYGYPNNVASLNINALCIGTSGPGGTWNGLSLPFALASVGIRSPANCLWGIDILASVPMRYMTGYTAANSSWMQLFAPLPIPADPMLEGATFYTQLAALDVDPATSQPTLLPSLIAQWQLGAGTMSTIGMLWNLGATATSGYVTHGQAAAFKLN